MPHLLAQAAHDIARFSPVFRVVVYGGSINSTNSYGLSIQRCPEHLAPHPELFDVDNELVCQTIVVVSYNVLARRNGSTSLADYLTKQRKFKAPEVQTLQWEAEKFPEWPDSIRRKFRYVVVDEAQTTKGVQSHSTYAIRWLEPVYTLLITATPIPWKHTDIIGLLAIIGDPSTNNDYLRMIGKAHESSSLPNPYELLPDGKPKHPELAKYCATPSAYNYHMAKVDDRVETMAIGQAIGLVYRAINMIRRDYSSTIQVSPDPNVPAYRIGDAMPKTTNTKLVLPFPPLAKSLYTLAVKQLLPNVPIKERTQGQQRDAGADVIAAMAINLRMSNMLSTNPLLHFTPSIHSVREPDPEDPTKKVANKAIEYLTRLFEDNTMKSDEEYILRLGDEMFENM